MTTIFYNTGAHLFMGERASNFNIIIIQGLRYVIGGKIAFPYMESH